MVPAADPKGCGLRAADQVAATGEAETTEWSRRPDEAEHTPGGGARRPREWRRDHVHGAGDPQ